MTMIGVGSGSNGGERLIRSKPPATNTLGNKSVSNKHDKNNNDGVNHKREIENRNSAKLGLIQIALGGSFDAALNIEEAVATVGDESISVEREAGLEGPEAAEEEQGGEGGVGGEEAGEGGEEEGEEGGEGGEVGGEGEAPGLDDGGLEGGAGGGEGGVEEEEGGGEGEGEVGGEREEGGASVGEEEGDGEQEEEEERCRRLEGGYAVDGGGAFD